MAIYHLRSPVLLVCAILYHTSENRVTHPDKSTLVVQ
ncbi:hypothetical protein GLUCOINTEAF2_0204109 [Komagataeibacter intermedius AF2]|uniref:Uncharacterized protein n=1 Tax=Komagataeibacter intermedius AF2 TaxID=1458464 RepID=A0A0N0MF98_9PROT|nr:hypothetical protein GLUCOINTEAF2_0204109 [Komagataeibacter intermedius AF2]